VLFSYIVFPSYMFQSEDNTADGHSVTPDIYYILFHTLHCWFCDIHNLKACSFPSFLLLIDLPEDGSMIEMCRNEM
jgi:hypothetical protein